MEMLSIEKATGVAAGRAVETEAVAVLAVEAAEAAGVVAVDHFRIARPLAMQQQRPLFRRVQATLKS